MSARVFAADGFRTDVTAPDTSGARAAPAGGAWKRGRGCSAIIAVIATLFGCAVAAGEPFETGSGVAYQFHDIIDEAPVWRLRFVVDGLGQAGLTYAELADELAVLCDAYALPKISEAGGDPERVVITLMSKPVEFGVMDPETTQFFESFTIEDASCIWEAF